MLTRREMQICKLISNGSTEKEIANRLLISPLTVHAHTRTIRQKTGARNIADITRIYITRLRYASLIKSLCHDL